MSIACIDAVWRCAYARGGSHLLILLALADFARDDGTEIRPSMGTLARRVRASQRQATRIVRDLERDGVIELVANASGGAPGATRVYRLRLDRLAPSERWQTGVADDRGDADVRGDTQGRDGCHPGSRRVSPMSPNPSLPVMNRELNPTSSAPPARHDAKAIIWNLGLQILVGAGESEQGARRFLGKFARGNEQKLAEAIGHLAANPKVDPKAYIARAMQPRRREFVA